MMSSSFTSPLATCFRQLVDVFVGRGLPALHDDAFVEKLVDGEVVERR